MSQQTKTNIEKFAKWIKDLNLDNIPIEIIEKTKLQNLSVLASLFSGAKSSGGTSVRNSVLNWNGNGSCTLLPNHKTSLHGALFAHSAYSMSYDFDDFCFMGHTGHSAILTPLVLGEYLSRNGKAISGKQILEAQIAGNEIAGRIGALCLIGPLNGQASSFIHLAGAAAAASKLMGHEEDEIANSIGIALMQPNNMLYPGFFSSSKIITSSVPILTGLQAAELAGSNLMGSNEILEPNKGLLKRFSFSPLTWALDGLGKAWITDTMVFKPWPGCAYLGAVVEAMEKILINVNPDHIQEVKVWTGILAKTMEKYGETFAPNLGIIRINFSVRYSLAVLLSHPEKKLTPKTIEDCLSNPTKLHKWAKKIHLLHDRKLNDITINELNKYHVQPLVGQWKNIKKIYSLAAHLAPPPIDLNIIEKLYMLKYFFGNSPELGNLEGLSLMFPAKVSVKVNDKWTEPVEIKRIRGTTCEEGPEKVVKAKFIQEAEKYLKGNTKKVEATVLKMEQMDIKDLWDLLTFTP